MLARGLEDVDRADDVDPRVHGGVGERLAHVDLRGEVEDELRARGVERGAHGGRVADVGLVERRAAPRARRSRFSRRPELRSSTIATSSPRARRASTRFDPMKPAPPVTSARMAREGTRPGVDRATVPLAAEHDRPGPTRAAAVSRGARGAAPRRRATRDGRALRSPRARASPHRRRAAARQRAAASPGGREVGVRQQLGERARRATAATGRPAAIASAHDEPERLGAARRDERDAPRPRAAARARASRTRPAKRTSPPSRAASARSSPSCGPVARDDERQALARRTRGSRRRRPCRAPAAPATSA